MAFSYNLIDEAWIPVTGLDGRARDASIASVLANAHEMEDIIDPSPMVQFGIYRLLIAIVARAIGIECIDDIAAAIERGQLDMNMLGAYLDKWHDRFDLFDGKYPFYQVPVDDEGAIVKKSVAELFKQIPVGTNVMHFFMNRIRESDHAVSPAACARALCSMPPFTITGGVGFAPGINKTPPVYVIVKGKNLFETIVLNAPAFPEMNQGDGTVAWESETTTMKTEVGQVSTLQGMTFQARRVHLFPGNGGTCTVTGVNSPVLVSNILFEQGLKFTGEWTDPSVAYFTTSNGRKSIHVIAGKDIWRDTGAIMFTVEKEMGSKKKGNKIVIERPSVVHQWNVLVREKMLPWRTIVVDVYAIRSDKAKIFEWWKESLSMPADVMNDPDAGNNVMLAMDNAGTIDYAIKAAIKKLYPRDGSGNKNAFEMVIRNALHEFWASIEPAFRNGFIGSIARRDKDDVNAWTTIHSTWKKKAIETGLSIVDSIADSTGKNARSIEKGVIARETFNGIIRNTILRVNVDG